MQRNEEVDAPTSIFDDASSRHHDVLRIDVSPPRDEINDFKTTVPWSADKAIADALGKVSLKEREQAYEDVHGISKSVDETPEMIADSMQKLVSELDSNKFKPAYDIAMELSEDFVTDHSLRLSFLRAEGYNPKKAAARMVRYFETKKELFGVGMLTKPITYEDLDSDTRKVVARGSITVLPARDTLGRYVFVSASQYHLTSLLEESIMSKVIWYILSTIVEDEISQIKGIVVITYSIGKEKLQPSEAKIKMWAATSHVATCVPVRASSFHHCYDTSLLSPMLKIITMAGSTFLCVRMRAHKGSHSECQYKLMTFGIPVKDFPVTIEGVLKTGRHKGWLERRKQKESFLRTNALPVGAVDIPVNFDVLLGKGFPCQEHPGNKHLHELVALSYREYDTAKRERKTEIAEDIVEKINKNSGRFLKREEDSGMWVEVSSREARDKVCHGFRRKREWDLKKTKLFEKTTTARAAMATVGKNHEGKNHDERQKRQKMSI